MIRVDCPALAGHQERYHDLAGVPLRVIAELVPGTRVVNYDPINLDNLLARAVVDEATGGRGLETLDDGWYWLPVPLRQLWESADGLPLYAATVFRPDGGQTEDRDYWHKRAQPGGWTRGALNPRNGRWMERRVPMPTLVAERLVAEAIGDPDEVARLLAPLSHISKRRGSGFGAVARWRVEPADFDLVRNGLLTRPLPVEAWELLGSLPTAAPAPIGWTMPQWRPALFRPGWWSETPAA